MLRRSKLLVFPRQPCLWALLLAYNLLNKEATTSSTDLWAFRVYKDTPREHVRQAILTFLMSSAVICPLLAASLAEHTHAALILGRLTYEHHSDIIGADRLVVSRSSRTGFCRNPRGISPNKVLGEFCGGFFGAFFGAFFFGKNMRKIHPKIHGKIQIKIWECRCQNPHDRSYLTRILVLPSDDMLYAYNENRRSQSCKGIRNRAIAIALH